jgi:ABC-2 type transport system ATP-binding protein
MQILIRCDRPSDLASRVFKEDHVVEVRVHNDRRGLLVKTSNPDRLYLLMNKIALDGIVFESVAPVDDDVNSVYEYLIGTEEVTR